MTDTGTGERAEIGAGSGDGDGRTTDGAPGSVDPAALQDRIDAGERVRLLDVRNRDEIDEWRIEGPTVDRIEVPYMKFVSANVTGDVAALVSDADPGSGPDSGPGSGPGSGSADSNGGPLIAVCGRGEASAEVAGWLTAAGVETANLAGGMEGWARVYRGVELAADAGGATVVQYRRPSSGCLSYLVVAGDEALVVDPLRAVADRYPADAAERGATVTTVLDTHVHADHVSGLRAVADAAGTAPVVPAGAAERGVAFDAATVAGGDALDVGGLSVRVLATPGHTTGAVSLRVGDAVLCGDTLFTDGIARPDLQADADGEDDERKEGADRLARELYRTLTERFAVLDDGAVIAPGHYRAPPPPAADGSYTAPLGTLRDRFAVFDESADAFVERVLASLPARPNEFERIVAVNLGRETVDDGTAFELELGPNNCAAAAE